MCDFSDLESAVDNFATAMKNRLRAKAAQGWTGWNSMDREELGERLLMNAAKGVTKKDKTSLVDAANLAMMIHHNNRRKA